MKKLAFATLVLVLTGCSRDPGAGPNPSPEPASTETQAPAVADSAVPPTGEPNATNAPPGTNAVASPFASLDPALQESFGKAEVASRIGDYATAMTELRYIADSTQLTAAQRQIVQTLHAEAQKNLSEATNDAAIQPGKK